MFIVSLLLQPLCVLATQLLQSDLDDDRYVLAQSKKKFRNKKQKTHLNQFGPRKKRTVNNKTQVCVINKINSKFNRAGFGRILKMERFNSRRAGWGGAWSNGHARNKSVRGGPRRRLGPSAPHQRFFLSFYFFSFILCEDAS